MAIIKFSAIVSDARGKIGGNVFSRNKGGSYIRTYVKPINPSTPKQTQVRVLFQVLVQSWKALTNAQRLAWNSAAPNFPYQDSLGNTKVYSGEQLYIKFNLNLIASGAASQANAPISEIVADPGLVGVTTLTNASIVLDFGGSMVPAGGAFNIYATDNLSAGISAPAKSKYRLITTVAAAADPAADIITPYTTVFGAPTATAKVFFMVRNIDQSYGQTSTDVITDSVVS